MATLKHFYSSLGEWHHTCGVKAHEVFHGYAQLLHEVVIERLLELDMIGILHIIWFLVGLAVEIYDAIFYLKGLSRQSHTSLDIILATVGGTSDNLTIFSLVGLDILTSGTVDAFEILTTLHGRE